MCTYGGFCKLWRTQSFGEIWSKPKWVYTLHPLSPQNDRCNYWMDKPGHFLFACHKNVNFWVLHKKYVFKISRLCKNEKTLFNHIVIFYASNSIHLSFNSQQIGRQTMRRLMENKTTWWENNVGGNWILPIIFDDAYEKLVQFCELH